MPVNRPPSFWVLFIVPLVIAALVGWVAVKLLWWLLPYLIIIALVGALVWWMTRALRRSI